MLSRPNHQFDSLLHSDQPFSEGIPSLRTQFSRLLFNVGPTRRFLVICIDESLFAF